VIAAQGLVLLAVATCQPVEQLLNIKAKSLERAASVSLQDCPPGTNSVRGVIRPVEDNEFVTVNVEVKVLPSGKAGPIPKPVLYDVADKPYKTAQAFGELTSSSSHSCSFSFRVPKGTKVSRFAIGDASVDLSGLEK
jgi:hypothetical protein